MHKICLAHFERDQAAGGNLYAKFARCYLQLAGKEPDQMKSKQALPAVATDTGQPDQVSYVTSLVILKLLCYFILVCHCASVVIACC